MSNKKPKLILYKTATGNVIICLDKKNQRNSTEECVCKSKIDVAESFQSSSEFSQIVTARSLNQKDQKDIDTSNIVAFPHQNGGRIQDSYVLETPETSNQIDEVEANIENTKETRKRRSLDRSVATDSNRVLEKQKELDVEDKTIQYGETSSLKQSPDRSKVKFGLFAHDLDESSGENKLEDQRKLDKSVQTEEKWPLVKQQVVEEAERKPEGVSLFQNTADEDLDSYKPQDVDSEKNSIAISDQKSQGFSVSSQNFTETNQEDKSITTSSKNNSLAQTSLDQKLEEISEHILEELASRESATLTENPNVTPLWEKPSEISEQASIQTTEIDESVSFDPSITAPALSSILLEDFPGRAKRIASFDYHRFSLDSHKPLVVKKTGSEVSPVKVPVRNVSQKLIDGAEVPAATKKKVKENAFFKLFKRLQSKKADKNKPPVDSVKPKGNKPKPLDPVKPMVMVHGVGVQNVNSTKAKRDVSFYRYKPRIGTPGLGYVPNRIYFVSF